MPKLSDDDYIRPDKTFTEKLTQNDIKQKLEDYEVVTDIKTLAVGMHVRYLVKQTDGTYKFRLGGNIINAAGLPTYIVLGNGTKSWSVQTSNTVFFSRLSIKAVKAEFTATIAEKDKEIKNLQDYAKDLKIENKNLKIELEKLKHKFKK